MAAPNPPGAPDLSADTDTGLLNSDNVTGANYLTFTGSSEPGDIDSSVTVFIDENANGAYDSGERSASNQVNNGSWTVENLSTVGLSGTVSVLAFLTAASDSANSAPGNALSLTIDHAGPTSSFSNFGISEDSGSSSADLVTNVASQTITATSSQALAAGETMWGSTNDGANWTDVTAFVSGTTLTWTGATLSAGGRIALRVDDQHGNMGPISTLDYTLDTTPPGTGMNIVAMGGDSNSDFIVNNSSQTVAGIMSASLQAGERVQVSSNAGVDWIDASSSVGSKTWSVSNVSLAASGKLQARILDEAGNAGPLYSRDYLVDSTRPTASVPAQSVLQGPTGATFQVAVEWADAGGGGVDSFSFSTTNITVTAPDMSGLTVNSYSVAGSVVTYTVNAPGGGWDASDAGRYTIGIRGNGVRDLAANGVTGVTSAGVIDVVFTTAPSVANLRLSADNGFSASDFHTNIALQTIGATLSRALLPGEIVQGTINGGANWMDISDQVDGTGVTWRDVALPASGTIAIRVLDADSHPGTAASHAFTVDAVVPLTTVATAALIVDAGASDGDFITNVGAQNMSGTLSAPRVGDEFVEVSFDNGAEWMTASGSGADWAVNGFLLPTSGTLQVRVSDTAGNASQAFAHTYRLDQTAPVAGTPVRANLVDPQGSSFTFTVTYVDTGAGLDTATAGTDNVTVTGPDGALTVSDCVVNGNVITYEVEAPGGDWDALDAGSYTIGITGTLRDLAGNAVAANASAHAFTVGVNSAPVLGGTFATPAIGDDETVTPFAGVTVTDADGDAVTLTITYTAANGTLAGTGLTGSAGNYTLSGSAATVQAALRDLVFTPTDNQSDGAPTATTFKLEASDGALAHANSATVVTVTPVAPTASIALSDAQLTAGETTTLTISFSEAVSGLANDDVIMPGGTLGTLTTSDGGRTWSTTFTPQAGVVLTTGQVVLELDGVVDAGGLAGDGTLFGPTYTLSTVRPGASIVVDDTTLTAGEATRVTVTFTQAVSGFTLDDLTVANGTLTNLLPADGGTTWTATLTPTAGRWVDANTVQLNLAGVQNADGNTGTGLATSNPFAVHTGSAPDPDPTPTPGTTVDGVTVVTGRVTDPATGLVNNTITVPFVTGSRQDDPDTPNADLADIPLTATRGAVSSTLTVGLPVGTGLQASSPASLLTREQALRDLIHRIEQQTGAGSATQDAMTGAGTDFLQGLQHDILLHSALLAPLAAPGSTLPTIAISGGGANSAAIGLVIDAGALPAGATLVIDDVAFAAIVGAATLRGGAGDNIVIGDGAAQDIAGGAGDDQLFGGAGNDVLVGGHSARGDWQFILGAGGTLGAHHEDDALALTALARGSAELAFLAAPRETLAEMALLYHAAFERAPDIGGLNFYLGAGVTAATLAQAIVASPEWAGDGLNTPSVSTFVQTLYRQVFEREADSGGLAFWSAQLASGSVSRADVLLAFALSGEHRTEQGEQLVIAADTVESENGWIGASGDDRLDGGAGSDLLEGGDGIDTIVYAGKLADYRISLGGDGAIRVADTASSDVDTVRGIERGDFSDGVVDLGFTQIDAATLTTLGLLYQTVFDRSGDIGGFGWWAGTGLSGSELVSGFTASTEFGARFGALSDGDFVAALYANSGLDADAIGGTAAWVNALHTQTRGELVGSWIAQDAVQAAQFGTDGLWLV